jgi:hypothetical protein
MSNPQTCANDIYSQMNYEKLRAENLKQTSDLYNRLLTDYSSVYSNYLRTQSEAIGNPTDPTLQNQNDMLNVKNRPVIIQLNQKLIDIETAILENNKTVQNDIDEQKKQLELEQKEKETIDAKVNKLDKLLKMMEDKAETSVYSVDDIKKQFDHATIWYYILIVFNIIIFIAFCIVFYLAITI